MLRRRPLAAMGAVVAVLAGLIVTTPPAPAEAASAADFTPGNLISDANFFDGDVMSAQAVQTLLQQKRPDCTSGYTCLKDYRQATPAMPATEYCSAIPGFSSQRGSDIIAHVGAACDISQRVLLVLLEKEQSLVTSSRPTARAYEAATGFACPDTAPCDASFGGFFYQVYNAARQFQRYAAYPQNYNHGVRTQQVLFHPNAACGSTAVRIENQATAGLYNYTPYQPNAAALANLYGTGDSCSAYGNRNFWRIFTDWFGDPRGGLAGPSVGALDARVTSSGNAVAVRGWAFDPDTSSPINVHVYAGAPFPSGRNVGTLTADQSVPAGMQAAEGRSDVGFSGTIAMPSGTTRVCAHAIDATGDGNTMVGCADISPTAGTPIGNFESAAALARTTALRGWAHDVDTTGPVEVHVYRGGIYGSGQFLGAFNANQSRPDVDRAVATAGPAHGFEIQVPLAAGAQTYCVYGINVGGGSNRMLGCRTVEGLSGPPRGSYESAAAVPGGVALRGWALDYDTVDPVRVSVVLDGRTVSTVTADETRPDIARAFPGYGEAHGFETTVSAGAGSHAVCVRVANVGAGGDVQLGCRTVTVEGGPPRGNFESVQLSPDRASTLLRGWALDPDTVEPVQVRATIDGRDAGTFTASELRPDVQRHYPSFGAPHGFEVQLPITAGTHQVCVTALDGVGGHADKLLGCRTVANVTQPPIGMFDGAGIDGANVVVHGWAFDPDAPTGDVRIRVAVNGQVATELVANQSRPDVDRAITAADATTGYRGSVPVPTGTSTICVTALDLVGDDAARLLGCRTVNR